MDGRLEVGKREGQMFFPLFNWTKRGGKDRSSSWKERGFSTLPGPTGLPFIGNFHQLHAHASNLPHHLWLLSKKYGPLMSLQLGFRSALVVSSANMAKEVLKTHDIEFADRPPFISHQIISRNGLDLTFSSCNEYWREMRKICAIHVFSSKRVLSLSSIRQDEISRTINSISKIASDSKVANLSEILFSSTNNIFCRIAFSKRYNDEGSARSKLFPFMGWLDRLTGRLAWAHKTFEELDLFLQETIDEHLDDDKRAPGSTDPEDISDVLLKLKDDNSFTVDLNMDHIKAILMDLFVAGTDPTSAATIWAMTELMRNPRAMNILQQEVRETIGEKTSIDDNDIQKLTYLKAVVKETLRLHPPAPLMVPHYLSKGCNVGGYEIKSDTLVYVNIWAIGRDPEYWEKPEEFLPERFLGNSTDFRGQDFQFIPFGAGRRSCPATNLGTIIVELALANLVYSFNWELPDGMKKEDIDMDVKPGITMHKKNDLLVLPKNAKAV
ncbi:hypothetical protein NMG60_11005200 [Bertholletia excelsa]